MSAHEYKNKGFSMPIKEYNNLYRCLKHETDYFNRRENKNGSKTS